MSETQKHTTRNGFITIIGTYIIWGLLPLYFVLMAPAGPIEIVVARVVFSLIFCALLLPMCGQPLTSAALSRIAASCWC